MRRVRGLRDPSDTCGLFDDTAVFRPCRVVQTLTIQTAALD